MKKIIIFYAKYGGGHLSAANSIGDCLKNNYSDLEVKVSDCMEYCNPFLEKLTTWAYSEMAKKFPKLWGKIYFKSESGLIANISNFFNRLMSKKLLKLLNDFNPDLVISAHPFSSQMVAYLKSKNMISCKLATVMTDFEIHKQWLVESSFVDFFFVSNKHMKDEMIDLNIPENRINVTGIPISTRFLKTYDSKSIKEEFDIKKENVILFFGGGEFGLGKDYNLSILKTILKIKPDYQIIAISGKNEKMHNSFLQLKEDFSNLTVLSYTNKVPELMSISSFVVTKPGGLTVSESLCSGLPIIIINPIPGQEEQNADFLEKYNVGIWLNKKDVAEDKLKDFFACTDKIETMKKNAKLLAKPNSTNDICKILIDNLKKEA